MWRVYPGLQRQIEVGEKRMKPCEVLDNLQFRNIITFLKNGGKRLSAAYLVRKVDSLSGGTMTIPEALDYVNDCHVRIGAEGLNEASAPDGGKEGKQ